MVASSKPVTWNPELVTEGLEDMTWTKICGITNLEDALLAASMGVDALGFIFAPSPRRVEPDTARKIIEILPGTLLKVGVFVDEDRCEIERVLKYCGLTAVQLHGNESPESCRGFSVPVFKALHIKDMKSLAAMDEYQDVSLVLDTYSPVRAGGTGISFPLEIALAARKKRNFVLSGGLRPSNVGEAVRKVRPLGVDVCSGVERTPGRKDSSSLIAFVKEVGKADEAAR
jgi:phosphoribosylanthranilate isomerase